MFRRILTSSIVFMFFIVQANAATHQGLKAAFDELNYSLNVEWDQKDQLFYQTKMNEFLKELALLKAQGLTHAEMLAFAKSEIKNQKVALDLEELSRVIQVNKMDEKQAAKYMLEAYKNSYQAGASWSGAHTASLILGILIITIVGAAVFAYMAYVVPLKDTWNEGVRECEQDPDCDMDDFDGDDGDDYDYGGGGGELCPMYYDDGSFAMVPC